MNLEKEIERLMQVFAAADTSKLEFLQGAIIENARMRCQLEEMNELTLKTGLVKFNPQHPTIHKMTPVFGALVKLRASYNNSTRMLCRELGVNEGDSEEDMSDFE